MKTEKLYRQYVNAESNQEKFEIIVQLLSISDEFDIAIEDVDCYNAYEIDNFLAENEEEIVRIWKKTIK